MINQAQLVQPNEIPYIWIEVKPLIEKALTHANGEMLSEDVLSLLLQNKEHLFIGYTNDEIQSALVGEIIDYPRKKVFRIITWSTKSGHDYEAWIDLFDTIEYFAKSKGCDSIEAWTRKGLARKLKWDNEYSVITKNIQEVHMSGGGGGGGGESDRQFAVRENTWEFDYTQMVNAHDFAVDQFEAQQWNQEQIRQHKNELAQNEWKDKETMRIFDYQNMVKAYNASIQAYHKQLDYNAIAAEISTNDNTRKYNERLTEIGFKNEDLIMAQAHQGRDLTAKIQAARADKNYQYDQIALKSLANQGKVRAMGQAGRSARKNLQAVLAEQGRAQSQLVDQITREETGYQFALERAGTEANFKQRQLQKSMESSGEQYDADNMQIALQKYSADMQAESRIAPEPQAKPQLSKPLDLPKPKMLAPPDRPTKAQWENLKPVKGSSGGGSGGFLGMASTVLGFASMIPGFPSDDRLKYDITRVGTSPSGIPKYTFRYRFDGEHGPKYMGTSAQDLIAMGREDAVGQTEKDGFYKVDYSKLDVTMEVVTT